MDLRSGLSYLFGSEKQVDLRRELVLLREHMWNRFSKLNDLQRRFICSGSLGEGVAYPASDDDLMIYLTRRVVKTYRDATRADDLLMVPSEHSPAYCLLLDVKHCYARNITQTIHEKPFLSSSLFKQLILRREIRSYQISHVIAPFLSNNTLNYLYFAFSILNHMDEGLSIHGPCVSDSNGYEADRACCFPCSFWPDVAHGWIIKNRSHGWPTQEMIQNIVERGCHVVAIGDPDSPFYLHEWRLSFSVAERTLMHSFNHVQFLTYNLLRLILKRMIEPFYPGVLCSYHIKTTIFYAIENKCRNECRNDDVETCFKACLSVLYDFVDHRNCPNYFIPQYNMIKRKVNHTRRNELQDLIRTLYNDSIEETLFFCGEFRCFFKNISLPIIEFKDDYEFMRSFNFFATLELFLVILKQSTPEDPESCTSLLFNVLSSLQSSGIEQLGNLFFSRGTIFCCEQLMNHLWSTCTQRVNKRNYRLHKSVELLLRIGFRGDVTTGKLTSATYLYLLGKTEPALLHIRLIFSEYQSYVLELCSPCELKEREYVKYMCGRGYTINYKATFAWAPPYRLEFSLLNAYPKALRMWIFIEKIFAIDALLYAYVIENLCYIRLQNHASIMKSTRCLVDRIDYLENQYKAKARMCVGIIKYVQSDCQSACRWLGSVYITKDAVSTSTSLLQRSAFTYLACLLNKRCKS